MKRYSQLQECSATDPFPTPRTIPAGWDLSGLETTRGEQADHNAPVPLPGATGNSLETGRSPEAFSDTRTVPGKWNLLEWHP